MVFTFGFKMGLGPNDRFTNGHRRHVHTGDDLRCPAERLCSDFISFPLTTEALTATPQMICVFRCVPDHLHLDQP